MQVKLFHQIKRKKEIFGQFLGESFHIKEIKY